MLLEFAGEHVGVHVEDGLAGARTGVEDQAELPTCELISEPLGHRDHVRKRLGVTRCEFDDIAVLRRLRDHEHVHRGLRVHVRKGDDSLGLRENFDRDLTRHDLAEYRLCCHVTILASPRLIVSRESIGLSVMEPTTQPSMSGAQTQATHISGRAQLAGFTLTEAQASAAEALEQLLGVIGGTTSAAEEHGRGIYLWGEVGRGKSWLMDAFLACVGHDRTWRVHYHDLFRHFHRAVYEGSAVAHTSDRSAVELALDELIGNRVVLCIDEFSVNDIADGMLSYRLFTELFSRGLYLVVTSNYHPDQLLPHPVYHEMYLPGIAQLSRELEVIEVGGTHDLRTMRRNPGTTQGEPGTEASHASTEAFRRGRLLSPDERGDLDAVLEDWGLSGRPATSLAVGNYTLEAAAVARDALRIDFGALCRDARATLDYLNLTDGFQRIVIDDVPRVSSEPEAVRRRWINLVDVLYDRAIEVVLVSEHPLPEILDTVHANRDTARTNSRLHLLHSH